MNGVHWPFNPEGTVMLSPEAQRVIYRLQQRRAAGHSMKQLAGWLRDHHCIEMTAAGVWRILKALPPMPLPSLRLRDGTTATAIDGIIDASFDEIETRAPWRPDCADAIRIDDLALNKFIARYGRAEAERRIAESFGQLLDTDVAMTIDDAGTVHIAEATS